MKKIVVIYWSGTGNTELMAKGIGEGADTLSTQVQVVNVSQASTDLVSQADALALGCPSMGDEVLEEHEMEPFVKSIEPLVQGKPLILFGSYGWGNGEWMVDWQNRMKQHGADLLEEGYIVNDIPDEDHMKACKDLGYLLAKKVNE